MPKITPIDTYKLIKLLNKLEFRSVEHRGLHVILINGQGTRIAASMHPGRKLKSGAYTTNNDRGRSNQREVLLRG
ncbi:MAG: hypothetical protein G5Z42_05185 [Caldisphaeraceae archaeon]|nr:hypothetical protein [Caldisphaeraceae archaeon]